MEEQTPNLCRSHRIKNKPPLPLEETLGRHQKHKKMQTTESRTSRTTSSPPSKIDPPESSFPLSTKPDITSSLAGKYDTIEIEVPELLLPEVIEPDFTKLHTLLPEVMQPELPQPPIHVTSRPFSSLPLSQIELQTIYLGPDSETLPYGICKY